MAEQRSNDSDLLLSFNWMRWTKQSQKSQSYRKTRNVRYQLVSEQAKPNYIRVEVRPCDRLGKEWSTLATPFPISGNGTVVRTKISRHRNDDFGIFFLYIPTLFPSIMWMACLAVYIQKIIFAFPLCTLKFFLEKNKPLPSGLAIQYTSQNDRFLNTQHIRR